MRLQVAVDNLAFLQIFESRRQLADQTPNLLFAQRRVLLDILVQVAAVAILKRKQSKSRRNRKEKREARDMRLVF